MNNGSGAPATPAAAIRPPPKSNECFPNVGNSAVAPFCSEEAFSLGFVILDDVFEFGVAAEVISPGVHPGCLLGTLAQGRGKFDKSVFLESMNLRLLEIKSPAGHLGQSHI